MDWSALWGALAILLLISTSVAVSGRPYQDENILASKDDTLPSIMGSFAGSTVWDIQSFEDCDCKAVCNGEPMEHDSKEECWGTFFWMCGNHSVGVMAAKCEGHFISFHVQEKQMHVAACEGLSHLFGCKRSTCPKTGHTVKRFYGRGCLGTGSSIMQHMPAPEAATTAAGTLPQEITDAIKANPELDQFLEDVVLGNVAAEEGGSVESRCKGYGGVVKAVKWGESSAETEQMDGPQAEFGRLQAAVEAVAGIIDLADNKEELGSDDSDSNSAGRDTMSMMVELARTTQSASSSRDAMHGTRLSDDVQHHHDYSCSITCNGKPAWMHGFWPCWGSLTVKCCSSASTAASVKPATRMLEFGESETSTIRASDEPSDEKSVTWKASCKGLWTGFLGKVCMGATLEHAEIKWPSGSVDKQVICTGKLMVSGHKDSNSLAMGHRCMGGEVDRVAYMHQAEDAVAST